MAAIARNSATLAVALALAAGCGGKSKSAEKPKAGAKAEGSAKGTNAAGVRPEDMDPYGAAHAPTTTFGDKGKGKSEGAAASPAEATAADQAKGSGKTASGDTGKAAAAEPGDAGPTAPPPPIKPPGLDLSEQEKSAKIADNLRKAQGALIAESPDAETGISEAKTALSVDEKNLEAMLYLAHGNYIKGYHDKAEYVLRRAEKAPRGDSSAPLYFLFGLVYEATDREDEAERAFNKALQLNGNYRSALLNVGVYHIKNKRYDQAAQLYERLTGPLASKSPAAWTNLGSAYRGQTARPNIPDAERKELILKAESAFKRATTFDKKYANAYYNLGLLYLDADPYPQGSGELDTLKRLIQAKTYFEEYSRMPGADKKLAKEQMAVAQKLHDREQRIREKRRKREERRKKKEQKKKSSSSGGWE